MTIIVADTTCGLPRDLLEKRGIPVDSTNRHVWGRVIPRRQRFRYRRIFAKTKSIAKNLPKTAAPEPPLYFPIFEAGAEKRRKRGCCCADW